MLSIDLMVGNLTKRCSHSQPVYRPCEDCVAARLNQIAKIYNKELSVGINEGNIAAKSQLKQAHDALQKVVDESRVLQDKLAKALVERAKIIRIVGDRNRKISDLEIRVRAEHSSKLKVLDLSEVEV